MATKRSMNIGCSLHWSAALPSATAHGHVETRWSESQQSCTLRPDNSWRHHVTKKGHDHALKRNSPAPDAAARRRISAERIIVSSSTGIWRLRQEVGQLSGFFYVRFCFCIFVWPAEEDRGRPGRQDIIKSTISRVCFDLKYNTRLFTLL